VVSWVENLLTDERSERLVEYPYHLRDNFLSAAERSFYGVLRQAVGDRALVFAKVSLNDLLYVKNSDYGLFRTYTNKIDRKHVDFLLCDPETVRPLAGVELDDGSHRRPERQERDAFVDQVFEAAGLPLVRVTARHASNVAELRKLVLEQVSFSTNGSEQSPVAEANGAELAEAPVCPDCQAKMVLRTAQRGAHKGEQFWGCSNYPKCQAIVAIES
jgi:very-short-patch-repair endonuclease